MSQDQDIVIGIDLGTTFSCAASFLDGKPKIIPSEKGHLLVPSVVGLTSKGDLIVGQPAFDQMVVNPTHTIYGSKRLIGRKFNSVIVQKMKEVMNYPIVEGDQQEAAVVLGNKKYNLSEIASFILSEVKDMAEGQLGKQINRAVITVPAYYNDNQRQAVVQAGKLAGFKVERIVNEPTAAAVGYGYKKKLHQRVLIYDLGGGTFDISILDIKDNVFKVLATGGDTFLGGVDFDTRIANYVVEQFHQLTGKDIRPEKVAMQRVMNACERAKRELSTEKLAKIELPYLTEVKGKPTDLKMKLSRDQLNKLTEDLVTRTVEMCNEVLKNVHLSPKQVQEVILVGGQTRMPLVQDTIERYLGKSPRKGVHPDEVVALGAAILGQVAATEVGLELIDVLSIPIGISLPNGSFKVILDKNIQLPAEKTYKLTPKKNEPIEIDIYQGESDEVLNNEYLGSFVFPPPEKKKGKEQKLEMRFQLTNQCLLSVVARDLDSGKKTTAQMTTKQTPKSLYNSLKAESEKNSDKSGWFSQFAKRVLGK